MTLTVELALTFAGACVTIGSGVVLLGDWLIRKKLKEDEDSTVNNLTKQVSALHASVNTLTEERNEARTDYDSAVQLRLQTAAAHAAETQRADGLDTQLTTSASQLAAMTTQQGETNKTQTTHANHIKHALEMEGAIWTNKVMADTPEFVPLKQRRTPIVSVFNLKGGVGKTTLTANLAWALSDRGYRVLLLDLDLQGSLSSMFLHNDELGRLADDGHSLFERFLKRANTNDPGRLLDFAIPVKQLNMHCRLVPTSDRLAYAEMSQTVRWLLRVGGTKQWNGRHDGRMILRRALHRKSLYKQFDVVLMDCPPLLNLCCSNALAASDYVLMPVLPSVKAIERIPPLLGRLKEIKDKGVNTHLHPLGIVVNRTDAQALTPNELLLFHNLRGQCHTVYGAPVEQFDTTVQRRSIIRDTEKHFTPPDNGHPLRATFEQLAEEFIKRLGPVCRDPVERDKRANEEAPVGESQ